MNDENVQYVNNLLQKLYLTSDLEDNTIKDLTEGIKKLPQDECQPIVVGFILKEFTRRTGLKQKKCLLNQLTVLLKEYPDLSPVLFKEVAREIQTFQNVVSSESNSKFVSFYFKITLLFPWQDLNDNDKNCLIELHSILCAYIAKTKNRVFFDCHYRHLKKYLSSLDQNNYCSFLSALCASTQSIDYLILWNNIIRFFSENGQNFPSSHKEAVLDLFVKTVIMSKTEIVDVLESFCFKNIISGFTIDDLTSRVFPALQKSILRSAEVSLSLIAFIFKSVTIDVSSLAQDMGKIIGTHLHSKDEALQEESVNGAKIFVEKCFKSEAVQFLLSHFGKIFHGSEGKLTVFNQKMSVIKSIGTLSFHSVDTDTERQQVFDKAIEEFIKIFKVETVESNVILTFSQIKLWTEKSDRLVISSQFSDYLKQFLKSKLSTTPAMSSLYDCLNALFSFESTIQKHLDLFKDQLISAIVNSSKNSTSSIAKIQLLTESLYASTLLLRIDSVNPNLENLGNFLSSLNQLGKITFLTDKFIAESSSECLLCLLDFIALVLKHKNLGDENNRILYKALLLLMCHQTYENVRSASINFYTDYSKSHMQILNDVFREYRDLYQNIPLEESDKINLRAVVKCCLSLINFEADPNDPNVTKLVFDVLHMCHMPIIYQFNSEMFILFLIKHFKQSKVIDAFVEKNFTSFLNLITNSNLDVAVKLNIVKTLVKLNAHRFINSLVNYCYVNLNQELVQLKSISETEYQIYITPEGSLYDKSVVLAAIDTPAEKNVKRESKLYSYKEQIAELEFRKELEAKSKDAKQELDLNKLSKKQREIYKQQLNSEELVRNRLRSLDQKVQFITDILVSMIETNSLVASLYFNEVVFLYVNLFSSILCSEKALGFFLQISRKMMISDSTSQEYEYSKFVDTLSHTLTKLYKTNERPNEGLCALIGRLVGYVHKRVCPNTIIYDEKLIRLANQNRLTGPAFSYAFLLFRYILLQCSDEMESYDDIVEKCLQIISEHTLIRSNGSTDLDSLKNPQYFPIKLMLETLVKFMEKKNMNNENLAATTLLNVVACVNGDAGCGKATTSEIFVLLNCLTHPNDLIRIFCFKALSCLSKNILPFISEDHCKTKLVHRVAIGQFDSLPECSEYAKKIFDDCRFETDPKMLNLILEEDISNVNSVLIMPLSDAFKALILQYPDELEASFVKLQKLYNEKALASVPSVDAFGRLLSRNHVDLYEPRLTIAYIFKNIVPLFNQKQVESFITFLIPNSLSDNNEHVRSVMLEAGCQLIDHHCRNNINYFLNVFESFLDSAPDDHKNDLVRKSVIIFMGTLAKHIDSDNPKLKPILSKLVEALSTPSQIVQEAVANCLQYLIPKFKGDAPALLQKLLEFLFESEIYGERKGAAYGIAGIVKGLGILSLNKLGIMDALIQAIQAKNKPNNREGALFAFEMLSSLLGRLFEPYIVHILPYLLDCFGDSSLRVRQAADDTAKIIMSKLSAPGVTLIYPVILKALEDDSWRKKTSSIELLGSMAYCAPKQLSQCLPKIVPKLMTVITDSHPKVQRSAAQALKQIGSVIKNPEIQAIVPTLLEALQDPANKTNCCLTTMLNMKFVHVIDPPSLALVMPVIERAFQNRSTETRKMSSQIIGNMYALTKSKDLSPYLPSIIPGIKNSLLDPVPEVRGVTARALGAMVKGLGDEILAELLPWLKEMLISESSSVDRSGAAQGLAEVLGGLGVDSLKQFMPEIIAITERSDVPYHVKDGYIMLYIYLPLVFTQHFAVYINQVVNPILQALADENELVRETALRAGQRIVNMYAETAIQLLLPELERGLFDENWRIRYSSVQLLGDLLFKIIGVSGKMTTESFHEDDNFGTEQSHKAIFEALGEERRNHVLAGLYMGRSDVSLQVRQASLHVWKVVVPNTPRTLKEILPILFSLLLGCLASNSSDRQQIAGRTLGDLVRKLGERILPEIIPILEQGLQSDRADQRQGVCIGLSEIISCTSREMIQTFTDSLIPTVKRALLDPLPEVRLSAAKTLDHLYSAIGNNAIDEILTVLIQNLDDPQTCEISLDSLKNIISYKSKVVLPYLIPKLIAPPVNTRALAFISSVAGDSLSKHLFKIIPVLLSALSEAYDTPGYQEQMENCQTVIVSITDEQGACSVVLTLLDAVKSEDLNMRRATTSLLVTYCVQSKPMIIAMFRTQLLGGLIHMLSSDDQFILNKCIDAINAITKNLDNQEKMNIIPDVAKDLKYTISDFKSTPEGANADHLPGFATNRGILPFLNLFKDALLTINLDLKEKAACGYRDVIENSSKEALKPSVMTITGPVIRMLSDRLSNDIKVIVIDLISILLNKVGIILKPFFPQIQTIFFRALSAEDRSVRLQAAISLGRFAGVHSRLDSLYSEMITLYRNLSVDQASLKETLFFAIRLSVSLTKDKIAEATQTQILNVLSVEMDTPNDAVRLTAASCLGELCAAFSPTQLETVCRSFLLVDDPDEDQSIKHFRIISLRIALKVAFERLSLHSTNWTHRVNSIVIAYIRSTRLPLIINAIKCAAYIIHHSIDRDLAIDSTLISIFARGMNNSHNEVKQAVATSTIFLSRKHSVIPVSILRSLVPLLVNGTKEKNSVVRVNSEQALVALFNLKDSDSNLLNKCIKCLDAGAAESLQDCVLKIRRNISKIDLKEEKFDDTLLS